MLNTFLRVVGHFWRQALEMPRGRDLQQEYQAKQDAHLIGCRDIGCSVTAYFCFGVLGVILSYSLADYTITGSDWLYGTIELIVMLVGVVVLPEQFTKSRNTKFVFPSAGYYERFIGK